MTVKLLYFATLRGLFGVSEEPFDLAPGSTLGELAELLLSRRPGLQEHLKSLAWGVNFEFANLQQALRDGDEVALLPPVSGGLA